MAEQKLLFWRQVDPTPGDVSLVFGEYQPPAAEDPNAVKLRFVAKVQPTPGAVALVFNAQPRLLPDVEFSLAAVLPAVSTSLSLTAQGEAYSAAAYVDGALAANIAPSSLPPISFSATGRTEVPGAVRSALPAVQLPTLAFSATQTVARTIGAMEAALPPAWVDLAVGVSGEQYVPAASAATLPAVGLPPLSIVTAGIEYDQALPDAIGPGVFARHLATQDDPVGIAVQQQPMLLARTPAKAHQTSADPLHASTTARQQQMQPASRASAQRAQHGIPLGNGRSIGHADTLRQRRTITPPAQHGTPLANGTHSQHQERIRFRHRLRSDQTHAEKVATTATARAQQARKTATPLYVGHQHAAKLPVGWWQATYPWPEPPFDPNAPSSPVALKFCRLADGTTALVFGCPQTQQPGTETIVVPVRRTYIVLNTVTLVRASDGVPLDATALSITFDVDSWLPTFSATLPEEQRGLVMPTSTLVEVRAVVNGSAFRFYVETVARTREFARRSVQISGRGVACELSAPYAQQTSHTPATDRTVQQIIDDALQFTGYDQQWGITDWLVPANTYSLYGTPSDVAADVATAAGAVLSASWDQRRLRMLPRYPTKPWEWSSATAEIVLPADVVQSESVEWREGGDHNVVYVSGTTTGVVGRVLRTGTAGDKPAQMVTHQLITHADAARQHGRTILSSAGRKAFMQLSLPILPETGVIDLCKLVEFSDGAQTRKGLVRANQIDVNWPTVRQTLTVEAQA